MAELRFDGQVAVITGAGGNPGLGRSYALALASRGAKVVVNDLGVGPDGRGAIGEGVSAVVREITDAGGEAIGNANSVAERDGASAIVEAAIESWGRIDILINNAGIAPFARFDELSGNDIERIVGVHLMGHIWMCRAAWPHMAAQGYGRLVNVSSGVAVMGLPTQSVYAASKLGVVGLTRSLAAEGSKLGIRANAIMPAADTLAWQTMLQPGFSKNARENGLLPELVAPVAMWLAHSNCSVSGKVIHAAAGAVSEVFISETAGTEPDPDLTPEAVDERIEKALDRSDATAYPDFGNDDIYESLRPYDPAPRA